MGIYNYIICIYMEMADIRNPAEAAGGSGGRGGLGSEPLCDQRGQCAVTCERGLCARCRVLTRVLRVSIALHVNVKVQLVTPSDPLDAYPGTLVITSPNNSAATTRVPFSWPTGRIEATLLSEPIAVAPGQRGAFQIVVRSLAGRETNVTFGTPSPESGPPQSIVSVPDVAVFVPRRGTATVSLIANVGPNVSLGTHDFPVFQSDFDDTDRFMSFRLELNVAGP
jgi:hypothetical protein